MPKYSYGGQAVIEGVMMRGRHTASVALRRSSGEVLVHEEQLNARVYANKVTQWPFIRGLLLLWDMLILGTRMMRFATNVYVRDELATQAGDSTNAATLSDTQPPSNNAITDQEQAALAVAPSSPASSVATASVGAIVEATPAEMSGIGGVGLALTLILSLAVAIGLFFLLPLGVVGLLQHWVGTGWLSLIIEGLIRLALLIGYLAAIGRMASVRRVFEYHGAEHKTINAYEAGDPLDVEHVRRASRVHTRCGTGFLLIVVVLSIFIFAFLGHPPLPLLILSRILLVPVIASLAYELMRLGAANYRYRVVRWLMAPSLALQGLTTREPDAQQMECAIVALERVLKSDGIPVLERVA